MKKVLRYILLIAFIGLLGYNSVYFKKLSEVKNTANAKFDPVAFSKKLWEEKLPAKLDNAVALPDLMVAVLQNKEAALKKFSNAIAIGNYRYAIIKTTGKVTAVNADDIQVEIPIADSLLKASIATEYIYGNAIRDASQLIDLKAFPNMADLNNVSEELNKIVRATVVPGFKQSVNPGDIVNITAAVEINKEHLKWQGIELLPVRLQIVK